MFLNPATIPPIPAIVGNAPNVSTSPTITSNKLFNKVESNNYVVNWISDFDSVQERGSYTSTDSSNETNFRQRWMRRMFMTPSEYKAYYNNVNHKFGSKATDVDGNNKSDE